MSDTPAAAAEVGQAVRQYQVTLEKVFRLAEDPTKLDELRNELEGIALANDITGGVSAVAVALRDPLETSLLHAAAASGNLPLLQWLVEICGKDSRELATGGKSGRTVFFYAACSGSVECFEFCWQHFDHSLLAIKDAQGMGFLDALVHHGNSLHLLQWIVQQVPWDDAFLSPKAAQGSALQWTAIKATQTGDDRAVHTMATLLRWMPSEALIKAHLECTNEIPPPLVMAAATSSTSAREVVQLFLAKGGLPLLEIAKDAEGCSALHNAAEIGAKNQVLDILDVCVGDTEKKRLCNMTNHKGASAYQLTTADAVRRILAPYTSDELKVEFNQKPEVPGGDSADGRESVSPVLGASLEASTVSRDAFETATAQKTEGNAKYSAGDIASALGQYQTALKTLGWTKEMRTIESNIESAEIPLADLRRFVAICLCNVAAMHQLMGDNWTARVEAKKATAVDTAWWKPPYRYACALRALGDWEEATQQMFEAHRREPTNQQLAKEFRECLEHAQAEYQGKQQAAVKK